MTETEAWMETAREAHKNAKYYRSLLVQIGEWFGKEAKTCDDGSVVLEVLVAKVPELVAKRLFFTIEDLRGAVARGWCYPATSHREMDGALAEAISSEVWKFINKERYMYSDRLMSEGEAKAKAYAAKMQGGLDVDQACSEPYAGTTACDVEYRAGLRDRVGSQLRDLRRQGVKRERLEELQFLLDKNPELARILDLLEEVRG